MSGPPESLLEFPLVSSVESPVESPVESSGASSVEFGPDSPPPEARLGSDGSAPRLFAALPLPEAVRERLALSAGRLAAAFPEARLRPVAVENLHLTLRFYGPAPDEEAAGILEDELRRGVARETNALRDRGAAPPRLSLPAVAPSPSDHRPRLVWAEAVEEPGSAGFLRALRQAAEAAARPAGFPPLRRLFRPHVTLARLRRPTPIPAGALASLVPAAGLWPTPFEVPAVELLESVLDPAGAIYNRRAAFPLE